MALGRIQLIFQRFTVVATLPFFHLRGVWPHFCPEALVMFLALWKTLTQRQLPNKCLPVSQRWMTGFSFLAMAWSGEGRKRCMASVYQPEKGTSWQITAKVKGLGWCEGGGCQYTHWKQNTYHTNCHRPSGLFIAVFLFFMPRLCKIKGNWHIDREAEPKKEHSKRLKRAENVF